MLVNKQGAPLGRQWFMKHLRVLHTTMIIVLVHLPNTPLPPIHSVMHYYSTHCNTAQIWSWCTECLSSIINRYPVI